VRLNFSAAKLSISTLIIMVFLLSIVSPTMAAQLPTSVKLNKTTITITVGSSETLKATVWPLSAANKAVTWSSSNSSVAEVVNGRITGAAPGTATIKVKTVEGNKTANCIVIVKAATVEPTVPAPITVKPLPAPIKSVLPIANPTASGIPKELTVEKGKSVNLSGTVKCSSGLEKISICVDNYYGATDGVIDTRAVSGNSYNLSNISINSNHAAFVKAGTYNVEIWAKAIGGTGKQVGSLTLTVTSAKVKPITPAPITVKPIVPAPIIVKPIPVPVKPVSPASVSLNKNSISLTVGSSETLNATVLPANSANKAVTWSSSNKSVAKVANGRITGVAPGTATITAKTANGNKTANCIVEVKAGTVKPIVPAPITVKPLPAPIKPISPTANPTASGIPKKLTLEKGKSVNLSGTVKCSSGLEKISICVDNYYGATDGVIDTRTVSGNSYSLSNITINSNHAAFVKAGTYNVEIWAKAIGGTGKQVGSLTLTVMPVLQSIRASVSEVSVEVGKSIPAGGSIKITGVYSDGSTKELTWLNDVIWSIKDPSIAKNGNGTIVGVYAGTTTLTLSYQGKTTSVKVKCETIKVSKLIPVENPGGGRIKDKSEPAKSDLVMVSGRGGTYPVHYLAKQALDEMTKEARKAGFASPLLQVSSGYRSVSKQWEIWNAERPKYKSDDACRQYVAYPGYSAHHSGRALDLYLGYPIDKDYIPQMKKSAIYKWLCQNASRFGFYPYDTEPWHWEYNPPAK